MNDRLDTILIALASTVACAFAGTVLFEIGATFVAWGLWMLRLAGIA